MSACTINWLDLQTQGSQPIVLKNFPHNCSRRLWEVEREGIIVDEHTSQ